MNGSVELFSACRKHGIKPILGCEVYVVDDHLRRAPGRLDRFHLTLLAATPTGYRNLVKLSSAGFLEGYQRGKPSVDMAQIAAHAEGVIALTGCLQSRFCQACSTAAPARRGRTPTSCFRRSAPTTSTSRSRRTASPPRTRPTRGSSRSRASSAGRWSVPATSTTCGARTTSHHAALLCVQTKSTLGAAEDHASTPTSSICAPTTRWPGVRRVARGDRDARSRSPSAATSSSSSAAS